MWYGLDVEEATFSSSDLDYVQASYATLDELCAERPETPDAVERLIVAGLLPQPTYVLPDGRRMFPRDYFQLADQAAGVEHLREWFFRRFREESERGELDPSNEWCAETEWQDYLDGTYGVCLWEVTPGTIAQKERLIRTIRTLIGEPREDDPSWREELADAVARLDALERPFTDLDRARWEYTSRALYVTDVRERFPDVFADAPRP
jgi:hypothetical protein